MAAPDNFQTYQVEFKKDTGLDWETNIHAYMQYYQARTFELMAQQQLQLLTQIEEAIKSIHSL